MNPLEFRPLDATRGVSSIQPGARKAAGSGDFAQIVGDVARDLDAAGESASKKVADVAAGKVDNLHTVMIEFGKAEVQFTYMMEVRNKLVEAYKEVMRMQL